MGRKIGVIVVLHIEGMGHKEFLQFVSIAKRSLGEFETQVTLAATLGYLVRCQELGNMLTGLKHALSLSSP
jgi:four helix bundle protein